MSPCGLACLLSSSSQPVDHDFFGGRMSYIFHIMYKLEILYGSPIGEDRMPALVDVCV